MQVLTSVSEFQHAYGTRQNDNAGALTSGFLTLRVEVTDCRPNNEPKDPCRIVLSLRKPRLEKGQCASRKSRPSLRESRQNCTAGLRAWAPGGGPNWSAWVMTSRCLRAGTLAPEPNSSQSVP